MTQSSDQNNEITVLDLFLILFRKWKVMGLFIAVITALGLVSYFLTPKEWEIKTEVIPESSNESVIPGSLGNLAGLAGINLSNSQSSSIPPAIYPKLLKSKPFLMNLLQQEYLTSANESMRVIDYVLLEQRKGGIFSLLPFVGNKDIDTSIETLDYSVLDTIISPTLTQQNAMEGLMSRTRVGVDVKSGVVSIYTEFQDPVYCAQIANYALDYIVSYVREHRTAQEKAKLEFIKGQMIEKEQEFIAAQDVLAKFQDSNIDLTRQSAITKLSKLQNDADLAFNIYSTLRQKYEESRISVQEKIPVIKIIEPVSIPLRKSKPRGLFTLIISGFIGVLLGAIYVLGSHFYRFFVAKARHK